MGENTDKHPVINELRSRVARVEVAVTNMGTTVAQMGAQVGQSVLEVSKELSELTREMDRRALAEAKEDAGWKVEHAKAVMGCEAKGRIAEEAKSIAVAAKNEAVGARETADKALRVANKVSQPKGHRWAQGVSWSALVAAITGLLLAITSWLKGHP